ncbi:MAG: hybrid sensor histidine kinase/response regulator, partial [Nitrospinae bacterium]|nr:hybrid sensor histidine kinase/response regulator [Nitrospinota bacterium]
LCICDNGHGVPDEAMPKLFDPFFSTKQNGTGLGLSIASRIIDKHGGTIHVYSETGKGTAFKIYLPRYAQSQSHERQLADR